MSPHSGDGSTRREFLASLLAAAGSVLVGGSVDAKKHTHKEKAELELPEKLPEVNFERTVLGKNFLKRVARNAQPESRERELEEARLFLVQMRDRALDFILANKYHSNKKGGEGRHESEQGLMRHIARMITRSEFEEATRVLKQMEEEGTLPFPREFVFGVIAIESGFKKDDLSSAGAMGLLQIMPRSRYTEHLKGSEFFDIRKNLTAGINELEGRIMDADGDVYFGLTSYNAGEGKMKKVLGQNGLDFEDHSVADFFEKYYGKRSDFPTVMYPLMAAVYEDLFGQLLQGKKIAQRDH